jgi:hypothetical protein
VGAVGGVIGDEEGGTAEGVEAEGEDDGTAIGGDDGPVATGGTSHEIGGIGAGDGEVVHDERGGAEVDEVDGLGRVGGRVGTEGERQGGEGDGGRHGRRQGAGGTALPGRGGWRAPWPGMARRAVWGMPGGMEVRRLV